MADSTEDLLIQIKADISGLKEGLDNAGKQVQDSTSKMGEAFKKVGSFIAEAFALGKVIGFVKESIKAFEELEKATAKLGKIINGTGGDWKTAKAGVLAFADELRDTTKFQKEELITTLGQVQFKVKDLATSMGIVRMATKLATISGDDLATSAKTLALAYQGSPRGVMQLARALGVAGEQAKDVGFLFSELEKRTKASSGEVETLAVKFNRLGKESLEIKEQVGEALAPATRFIADLLNKWVPKIFYAVKGMGIVFAGFFLDIGTRIGGITDQFKALVTFLSNLNHPIDAWKQYSADRARISKETDAQLLINAKVTQEEVDKLYAHDEVQYKEKSAKKIAQGAKENKDRIDDTKKANQKMLDDAKKLASELRALTAKALDETAKYLVTDLEMVAKATFQAIQSGKDVFASLGKVMVTAIVGALVKIAEAYAEFYAGKAVTDLMTENYIGAGEDALASAKWAVLAGAIGAIGSSWTGLAEGGVVTGPTRALIGEGGEPEAVVPLSKAGDMGFGGTTVHGGISINLPNVKDANGFTSAEGKRSMARALSEMLDQVQRRKGLSLSSGVA